MASTSRFSGSGDKSVIRVWARALAEMPRAKAITARNEIACFTISSSVGGLLCWPLRAGFCYVAGHRTYSLPFSRVNLKSVPENGQPQGVIPRRSGRMSSRGRSSRESPRRERHGYQELRGVNEVIRSFRAFTKAEGSAFWFSRQERRCESRGRPS